MRLSGSFLVFSDVSLAFMPDIRAQNDFRLAASFSVFGFGAGGFKFIPCFFAEARPLALRPPLGFFPSFLCHAGDLAICYFQLEFPNLLEHGAHHIGLKVTREFFGAHVRQTD